MDDADALAVSSSLWSMVCSYFSPATLFLLLNMVIATIKLTSRSHRRRCRDYDDQPRHHHYQYALAPPPPLARTSSVLECLRSLGLYRFRSGNFPPEYSHHLSAAHEGAAAATHSSSSVTKQDQAQHARSRSEPATRSLLVRRNNDNKEDHAVLKKLERAPPQAQAQVRRPPRGLVVREEEDAAAVSVDARADDFINKFRQQLQLQRLNSLLNYKEMINRGL